MELKLKTKNQLVTIPPDLYTSLVTEFGEPIRDFDITVYDKFGEPIRKKSECAKMRWIQKPNWGVGIIPDSVRALVVEGFNKYQLMGPEIGCYGIRTARGIVKFPYDNLYGKVRIKGKTVSVMGVLLNCLCDISGYKMVGIPVLGICEDSIYLQKLAEEKQLIMKRKKEREMNKRIDKALEEKNQAEKKLMKLIREVNEKY